MKWWKYLLAIPVFIVLFLAIVGLIPTIFNFDYYQTICENKLLYNLFPCGSGWGDQAGDLSFGFIVWLAVSVLIVRWKWN